MKTLPAHCKAVYKPHTLPRHENHTALLHAFYDHKPCTTATGTLHYPGTAGVAFTWRYSSTPHSTSTQLKPSHHPTAPSQRSLISNTYSRYQQAAPAATRHPQTISKPGTDASTSMCSSMCQGPASRDPCCLILSVLVFHGHTILVLLKVRQPAAIQPVYRPGSLQGTAVADESKLSIHLAAPGQHLGVPHHLEGQRRHHTTRAAAGGLGEGADANMLLQEIYTSHVAQQQH